MLMIDSPSATIERVADLDVNWQLGVGTRLAHWGEEEKIGGAVVPPLFQNSLFVFETSDELLQALSQHTIREPHHYSRLSNPTIELAEKKIAMLENAECCKVTGCGQAAIANAIMSAVEGGSHVIAVDTVYRPGRILLEDYLNRFGVETTFVSGLDTDELLDAIRPNTSLIYLESPSSLMFRVQDIPTIAREARAKGITTMIDNTYCTPLLMNPLEMGIDLVVHSATKYFGGHSDLTAGAICGDQRLIDRITRREGDLFGNILHPFTAWLLVRGLRTLHVRLKYHEASANLLAGWLEDRPEIEVVHHVGLASHPQHRLIRQMMRGSTGLFSFEPKVQDPERVKAFVDALKLFGKGVSWGGFESLAIPLPVKPLGYDEQRWIVRLFCGLEDVEDLRRDVEQALVHLS